MAVLVPAWRIATFASPTDRDNSSRGCEVVELERCSCCVSCSFVVLYERQQRRTEQPPSPLHSPSTNLHPGCALGGRMVVRALSDLVPCAWQPLHCSKTAKPAKPQTPTLKIPIRRARPLSSLLEPHTTQRSQRSYCAVPYLTVPPRFFDSDATLSRDHVISFVHTFD